MSLSTGELIIQENVKLKNNTWSQLSSKNLNNHKISTGNVPFFPDPSAKAADIKERKKLRAKKLEEFKDYTEKVLGSSFEEDHWKPDNKDDDKKIEVKIFDRKLLKHLNLTGYE